jgi:hypothetical protein
MLIRRILPHGIALAAFLLCHAAAIAQEVKGTVESVDLQQRTIKLNLPGLHKSTTVHVLPDSTYDVVKDGKTVGLEGLKKGDRLTVTNATWGGKIAYNPPKAEAPLVQEFWDNFRHNIFKPLLLFFYMGFLVPILKVKFEFPYVIYQGLTIFLLIAIGWHGGEELADLDSSVLGRALGFMGVGFVTNFVIGILAYIGLSLMTKMRRIDKATVAGYYGSDSAGTFVTCVGVLTAANLAFDAYMPVMLAVMEIPGCLVAIYLVSRFRGQGMDPAGTMPDEPGYDPNAAPPYQPDHDQNGHGDSAAVNEEKRMSMEVQDHPNGGQNGNGTKKKSGISPKLLHEVFLNPGLYLLFGGIIIGFVSRRQGADVTRDDDNFFNVLFQGMLCLFLLEMGMTASRKLKDLRTAGWGYIAFGLIAPNVFATLGIVVAHMYAKLTGSEFEPGTYVLFAVLCGAASYIAVPAVQRLAIPEASPTLPLAASLGLTFSYNVTIGIPIYIQVAKAIKQMWP